VFYSSFALVTPEIEADLDYGERRMINAPEFFGIDDQGAIKFQGPDQITWAEFLRAHQAGLYEGNPTRIVVYPYGGLGGLSPNGVWEAVQWLFENREVVTDELERVLLIGGMVEGGRRLITHERRRQIAKKWRAQGFNAPRIRRYLAKCPQWDPSQLAKQTNLTDSEAQVALKNAGYEAGQDGLWRPSDTEEGRQRRKGLEEIERRAYADMKEKWL
jgi:hypothetical protein